MSREKLVIRENVAFRAMYDALQDGDIVVGRLRLRESEEPILVDLLERGINLIPSGLSQLASRSKSLQATILEPFMLPLTRVIHARHDLIAAISDYRKNSVNTVVTKLDRMNAGMGVHLWQSVEDVYTHACLGSIPFPFVLQPFEPECRDIRVVFLADYIEAYQRYNPNNFRNNLHHGGGYEPYALSGEQLELCRRVLKRGRFPYGHIDLMVTGGGISYVGEINLRGGIRGARITPEEYRLKVDAIHSQLLAEYSA